MENFKKLRDNVDGRAHADLEKHDKRYENRCVCVCVCVCVHARARVPRVTSRNRTRARDACANKPKLGLRNPIEDGFYLHTSVWWR
jgi:hypothetical protein